MAGHEQLTIQLPLSDAEFAREFATRNKISVSELVDRLLKNLQRVSEHRIDPVVQSWIGILPKDTDIDAVRMDYLTKKYLSDENND
jgi:hypothetical protein